MNVQLVKKIPVRTYIHTHGCAFASTSSRYLLTACVLLSLHSPLEWQRVCGKASGTVRLWQSSGGMKWSRVLMVSWPHTVMLCKCVQPQRGF